MQGFEKNIWRLGPSNISPARGDEGNIQILGAGEGKNNEKRNELFSIYDTIPYYLFHPWKNKFN